MNGPPLSLIYLQRCVEMVRQWQPEVVGDAVGNWCSHGAAFCQKCNEIGSQLRLLPERIATDASGNSTLPSCACWPHNARRRTVRCPAPRRGKWRIISSVVRVAIAELADPAVRPSCFKRPRAPGPLQTPRPGDRFKRTLASLNRTTLYREH